MILKLSTTQHLRLSAARFLRDEEGSATVWNLLWLIGFAVMGGVAIDSTNAWRHKTMMASTADVASLAGAWDLPEDFMGIDYSMLDQDPIKNVAYEFALKNLSTWEHGRYITRDADIIVGHWDKTNRQFIPGSEFTTPDQYTLNAVQAWNARNRDRANSLPTSLLRFVRVWDWEIETEAVAAYGQDSCVVNGIISRGDLEIMSNATIHNADCLHGQLQTKIQNNVTWMTGDIFATTGEPLPDIKGGDRVGSWDVRDGQYDADGNQLDASDGAERHVDLYPVNVDYVPSIGAAMLTGLPGYRHMTYPAQPTGVDDSYRPPVVVLPESLLTIDGTATATTETDFGDPGNLSLSAQVVGETQTYEDFDRIMPNGKQDWYDDDTDFGELALNVDTTFSVADGTAESHLEKKKIYYRGGCKPNETLLLKGVIEDITLITDCTIDFDPNSEVQNAVLLTSAEGSQSVQLSGARVGAATTCEDWGGVRIYSDGDIRTSSGAEFYNVGLVAKDEIHFAAKSDSINGISMQAGRKIIIAANAEIGGLDSSQLPANPAGGCPDEGVGKEVDATAYTVALVR